MMTTGNAMQCWEKRGAGWRCPMSTSISKTGRIIPQPLEAGPGVEQHPLFEGEFTPKSHA